MAEVVCENENATKTIEISPVFEIQLILGIVGNLAAIVVLLKNSGYHNWKIFYRLTLTLSCSDLLGILFISSVLIFELVSDFRWIGDTAACDLEAIYLIFCSVANLLIVTTMSCERFLALWHPYTYTTLKSKTAVMLIPVWIIIFAVVVSILPLLDLGHFSQLYPCTFCFFDVYGTDIVDHTYVYIFSAISLTLICVSVVLNILVVVALSRNQKGSRRSRGSWISLNYDPKDFYAMVSVVGGVILILVVFWGTFLVKLIMITFEDSESQDFQSDYVYFWLVSWVPVIDPWVYVLLRRENVQCLGSVCRKQKRLSSSYEARHYSDYGSIR